jgi:hypothetical protein
VDLENLSIINIYAPNDKDEKVLFYQKLIPIVNQNSILIGDFNFVEHPSDKSSGNFTSDETNKVFNFLRMKYSLSDVALHTGNTSHTWFTSLISTRIDRVYVPQTLIANANYENIRMPSPFDHNLIAVSWSPYKPLRNRWLLDKSLLDNVTIPIINNFLLEVQNSIQTHTAWTEAKVKIKRFLMDYAQDKLQKSNAQEKKIDLELQKPNLNHEDFLRLSKQKLDFIQTKYDQIRQKCKTLFDTATTYPTSFLSSLVRERQIENEIVLDINGEKISKPETIADQLAKHWNGVHQKKMIRTQDFLNDLPKIKDPNSLELDISPNEVFSSIKKLRNLSSPGPDGLTSVFYKVFAKQITPILTRIFNFSLARGFLACGMNQAAIRFILKKGQDRFSPKSWRPISLINNDAKILSRIISNRLQTVVDQICGEQKAYIRSRNILENVYVMEAILQNKNSDTYIFLSDFSSAFDSMQHQWILETLKGFGFGNKFIGYVKTCLTNLVAFPIIKSGIHYKSKIFLNAGVRQGDPLSGLLFIIGMQPLLNYLKKKLNALTLSYADDVATIVDCYRKTNQTIEIFKNFKDASGLTLNFKKSRIFNTFFRDAQIEGISLSNQNFSYLGYEFSKNGSVANFEEIFQSILSTMSRLKNWNYTIPQKVCILNCYLYPKFFYHLYATSPSENFFKKINKLTNWFLSNSKQPFSEAIAYRNLMSLERMQRDPAHGGFKLLDVKSRFLAFKLQLFTKVINNKSNPLHKYLIKRLTNLEQKTNHSPIFSLKGKFNLPPIINDMIKAARIVKLSCSPTSRITCKTNQLFSKDLFMSPNGSPPQLLTPSLKVIYFCIKTQISNPLSLTKTQQSWINLKNMDLSKIFKFLKKKKAFKPCDQILLHSTMEQCPLLPGHVSCL